MFARCHVRARTRSEAPLLDSDYVSSDSTSRVARRLLSCALASMMAATTSSSTAITIEFNYNMDLQGFFGSDEQPTPARAALEFVADAFEPFGDKLAPINPGGSDSWSAFFTNPGGGFQACACNVTVPADTLVIYAGARDLPGSELAQAGPGVWGVDHPASASLEFQRAVGNRGQGSVLNDFAPWGGVLAFDTTLSDGSERSWHFDPLTSPVFPQYDFASVAMHEIAHILGFGIAPTFARHTIDGRYAGPATSELYGGPVPLDEGSAHWQSGTTSPPHTVDPLVAALGPSLAAGERKLLTPLDYAALVDVGWQAPGALLGLLGDVDGDLDVDGADLLAWQRDYGLSDLPGDVNEDRKVNAYDLWLIEQNYGAGAIPAQAGLTAPEPSTASLLALLLVALLLLARGLDRPMPYPKGKR